MKSHVWRPLYLALCVVAVVLLARMVLVPKDFGVWERGYMYGWHRKSNEAEWEAVKVKYKTAEHCKTCHQDKYNDIKNSPHAAIMCENCHGPSLDHPKDPPTLTIDRSRELCVRCHFFLPYKTSGRGAIKGINPVTHHPEAECVLCHYPHNPKREVRK
ncbi:MAG TPA: cytochrome C [Geobacteraceae bacterium]